MEHVKHAEDLGYLGSLSELTARSFASSQEAMAATLKLLVDQLGMASAFLSRIMPGEGRFEVVAAHDPHGACGITVGAVMPLSQTY